MAVIDSSPPLHVLLAPDSFKGSLSARGVCEAMSAGLDRLGPRFELTRMPLADGGEGSVDVIVAARGHDLRTVSTADALGRPVRASYALSKDHRSAVVEIAAASGLPGIADLPAAALSASTEGTGVLIRDALDHGVEEVVLCLGGSATTDGGTGILRSLGARFLDSQGRDLQPGGGALQNLATVDFSGLAPGLRRVRWRLATDVTSPAWGPTGAAHVFGPQKGASPDDVEALDRGLQRLGHVLSAAGLPVTPQLPGMGAAGATPLGLFAVFEARIESGARMVMELAGFSDAAARADLVVTGEGRFDDQSLQGKVVGEVARQAAGRPVLVIAGSVDVEPEQAYRAGVAAAFSIAPGPASLRSLCAEASDLIARTSYDVFAAVLAGRPSPHPQSLP
ncbi:glycerate kinase [Aeromicrobium camelliae]|uniref:Glycerate kinase n=1 Tax=Aeromicrobium camelliae TaxID=1538144 RepID=A0A3N6ZQE4_9ACTN|nr:glycerate kinase [Aeromicrobium camelliae]RQN09277.1 glycerate kinase [Aeromicrobium camelliae]